jgi:glycosyltransferase involved in cell wall biosynthesis
MNNPITLLPNWHISVLIPARNEEMLLPRCLASVLRSRALLPPSISCDVVVAVDRSTDATLAIATDMLSGYGTVAATEAGMVGQARALAAAIALENHADVRSRCWLANTDADCIVPEDWLLKQISLADEGMEAIAGIVDVDSFHEHAPHVVDRFHATYAIHPDGSHPHVHGANLGLRADAYLRAGGWRELATAEDHDLWQRLLHTHAKIISTSRLRVVTSGRRQGRAPHGFAGALASHNESTA